VVSADYYTYNDADQLTAVVETIAGGPAVELVYTYNDAGECSGVTASIGGSVDSSGNYTGGTLDYQNTYGYDANGDLTQIIQTGQTGGDAVATKEIDLTYNAAGQFQSITRYENGQLVAETDYTYNSAGQLTGLVHEQGSSNVLASYAYTYGAGTALASAVQPVTPTVWTPGGATLPFDDPSQIDLSSLDQAPSPASLLASVTSVDGTATYSYDAMGQLTAASCTGAQPSETYSWDANGNPSGSGYVIGPDNELLSDGTYNYAYNADGDCTSRTDIATGAVTDYTWDARNRLVGVTDETSTGQVTQAVTYVYDVENRCVGETVTAYSGGNPASVHTTDFAYDGNQIVLQFDATTTPGTPVSLTANNLSHRYLNGPAVDQVMSDERVTLQDGALATDEVLWPLADAQGTIRDVAKLTGTTAAVVDHVIYNSFGGVVSESDPSQGVLFKSTGCFTDPATDIEFHEQRGKIAGSVDWLKVDPSGETSGTTNLYGYCGESPTNFTDPSGLGASSLTRQELSEMSDDEFAELVYRKALLLYDELMQHKDNAYAEAMANVINQKFLHLPASLAQQLAVTPPETLDKIEEFCDLLMKVGEAFEGTLEKVSIAAENAQTQGAVKTVIVEVLLTSGYSVWIKDTDGVLKVTVFWGTKLPVAVTWYDPNYVDTSLLAKAGVAASKLTKFIEIGTRICHFYERFAGVLKMYKGLVSCDAAGSLGYLQGALQFVGASAPASVSLAITWVYSREVGAAIEMIRGIERLMTIQCLDRLLAAALMNSQELEASLKYAIDANTRDVPFSKTWFGDDLTKELAKVWSDREWRAIQIEAMMRGIDPWDLWMRRMNGEDDDWYDDD
jgi:RHS repeat-associated protein